MAKAVASPAWYGKWGAHYLRSAACAHAAQFCLNFKDRALQHYAGLPAKELQESLRIVFCSLPAPEPTRGAIIAAMRGSGGSAAGGPHAAPAAAPAMDAYYNLRGGCFDGDGLVRLAGGAAVPVRALRRGDQLAVRGEGGGVQYPPVAAIDGLSST